MSRRRMRSCFFAITLVSLLLFVGCDQSRDTQAPTPQSTPSRPQAPTPVVAADPTPTAPATQNETIHKAAAKGDLADIRIFLESGVDPNARTDSGNTPLHSVQTVEAALYLIEQGADVNAMNNTKWTPLLMAALKKNIPVVQALLEKGADINAPDGSDMTALHHAVRRKSLPLVQLLIEKKADLSVRDKEGWTPLHHAALKNELEIAQALLDAGADVNAASNGGGRPLHEAAVGTSKEMIDLLIAAGAEIEAKTKEDKTAMQYAMEAEENDELVQALAAHGAKTE